MDGRNFMHPSRDPKCTEIVYGGRGVDFDELVDLMETGWRAENPYKIFWGEIHGHTGLSDGLGTLDDYFSAARDHARLDFCAVTDHDHGGVGRPELWGEKWELTQAKVAEYNRPGEFVTLLGYERDSWPWYSNLCIYYRNGSGDMIRGEKDGHITRGELESLLSRDDVVAIPHHTADISQGVNFDAVPVELMTPLIEVYSKWGTGEYFGNPNPVAMEARGGHWRDALEKGAKMGCVGGSDIHTPHPGIPHDSGGNLIHRQPGLVAVLAKELTREAVFEAIKARRCYASAGAKTAIDFRVNQAFMGEQITPLANGERRIFISITAPDPIDKVDIIKNSNNHFSGNVSGRSNRFDLRVIDLKTERDTDYYYIRVTLSDGRQSWSSPIWVGPT